MSSSFLPTAGEYFRRPEEEVAEPIFVGAKRFEVEEIYLDEIEEQIPGLQECAGGRRHTEMADKPRTTSAVATYPPDCSIELTRQTFSR